MTAPRQDRPLEQGAPAGLSERLGDAAARAVLATADIWLLIAPDGLILDAGSPGPDMPDSLGSSLANQNVFDTLAADSHAKARLMLEIDRLAHDGPLWREINHALHARQTPLAIRYSSTAVGDGLVLWVGRDLSQASALHGWLLQAQQDMEREQAHLRASLQTTQTVLAHIPQAVIVVDPGSRKIDQANQAAQRVAGRKQPLKAGEPVSRYFDRDSQDALGELISEAVLGHAASAEVALAGDAGEVRVEAVAVRTARSTRVLLTLGQPQNPGHHVDGEPWHKVAHALPGALAVADRSLAITAVNPAFLDLSGFPSKAAAIGTALGDVLGRTGIEMSVLHANLREHGAVQNFATVLRSLSGRLVDVLISAVTLGGSDSQTYALLITPPLPGAARTAPAANPAPVSDVDYTALIGRQSLKDIVRDAADGIERRCIEHALGMTGNNRASAAELLGLSRQSLYTKLHRYGLASGDEDA